MALIHQNHCQHGWERFLPWHRIYLYEFEQVLQDICPGRHACLTGISRCRSIVPNSRRRARSSRVRYKAYLTEESLIYLEKADPSSAACRQSKSCAREWLNKDKRYTSQTKFFAAVAKLTDKKYTVGKHRERFIDALLAANALWYPLRYPAEYNGRKRTQSTR